MSYYIVRRDPASGALSLALPDEFASRDYALGALSAAVASGAVDAHGSLFIADLEHAVPVLIVPGRAHRAEAPLADAMPDAPADERTEEAHDAGAPPAEQLPPASAPPAPPKIMASFADEPWPWADHALLEALIGADAERTAERTALKTPRAADENR